MFVHVSGVHSAFAIRVCCAFVFAVARTPRAVPRFARCHRRNFSLFGQAKPGAAANIGLALAGSLRKACHVRSLALSTRHFRSASRSAIVLASFISNSCIRSDSLRSHRLRHLTEILTVRTVAVGIGGVAPRPKLPPSNGKLHSQQQSFAESSEYRRLQM